MPSAPPIVSAKDDASDYVSRRATSAPALWAPDFGPAKAHLPVLHSVAGLVRLGLKRSDNNLSFERPDLIEDDYYRFRHQPRD